MRRLLALLALLTACGDTVTASTGGELDWSTPPRPVTDASADGPPVRPDSAAPPPADAAPGDGPQTVADAATDGPQATDTAPTLPDAAPEGLADLMARGLELLAQARTHEARAVFAEAHALAPGHTNATFALALAQSLDALELAGMLLTLPGQLAAISRNEAVADSLHEELLGIRNDLAEAIDLTDELDPDAVALDVESAWLYLPVQPVLVYRGRFDGGDLHLLRASGSFLVGLFDVLAGNDLRTDLFGLIDGIEGLGFDFRGLGALLGHLLRAEGGHFLAARDDAFPELWRDAQQRFSAVGRELNLAVQWMAAEAPTEIPQVSFVEPLRGGAGYTLTVNGLAHQDEAFVITERPYEIDLPNHLLAAFDHASRAIVTPGDVVDFRNEFLPIAAVMVHVATRVQVLNTLLGELPIDLALLNRTAIETLLKTLLPLPMGMDPGALYEGPPVGLRLILPRVNDGEPARFLAEWECPDALGPDGLPPGGGWTCPADAALVDAPHFDGAFDADGIAAPGPYLRFEDATMSGLAQIDLDDSGTWTVPTEAQLSTALATSLPPLLNLIGGL